MDAKRLSPAKLRILIADDHEVLRRGLRELLELRSDWHVTGEASNGREAVRLALKTTPDIVLLDLFMPDMNGLEATRAIKKELPNTEVLIFTISRSEELVSEVLAAGARGYLLKTETTRTVVAAIESLAGHHPFFSPHISKKLLANYVKAHAATATAPNAVGLTAREREILQLLAEGHTNKTVSALLRISMKTVETHRATIMRKIEAQSIADLIRYAVRAKVIEP